MGSNLFKQYEGVFEEISEKAPKAAAKKESFFGLNAFALQDAVGEKSAKKSWIEYQKLRFEGGEAEEIIYKIVSKVSGLSALAKGASKEELGVSDYPFSKLKKDLKNWKPEELESLHRRLVTAFHLSRMGGDELDLAIEKILLSI